MVATLMPLADWCSGGHRPNFPIINGLSQYSLPQGASQSARIGSRAAHHETACPYHCGKVQDFPSSGFSPHQSFTRSFFMCDSHRHHETTTTAAAPAGAGVTFHVSDMTCGHCAGVIRSALEESLPGAAIEIDIAKAQVTVSGDQAKAAEEAIRTAGYTPVEIGH